MSKKASKEQTKYILRRLNEISAEAQQYKSWNEIDTPIVKKLISSRVSFRPISEIKSRVTERLRSTTEHNCHEVSKVPLSDILKIDFDLASVIYKETEELRKKEIDINDDYGIALLIDASLNCRKDIVEYLLDNGADPNYKDYYDVTVLMYAEGNNCIEVVELLLNNGADLDIVAYDGRTVLDSARDNGHTEIIELLEAAGAE